MRDLAIELLCVVGDVAGSLKEAVGDSEISRVLKKWVVGSGNDRPEVPPIRDVVFRIMSADEWSKMKRGYFSGSFWSSDPTEYARGYFDNTGVLAVAKSSKNKKYKGMPDKKKIASGQQHYNDLDKKELSDLLFVYTRSGAKLTRVDIPKKGMWREAITRNHAVVQSHLDLVRQHEGWATKASDDEERRAHLEAAKMHQQAADVYDKLNDDNKGIRAAKKIRTAALKATRALK